MAIVEYEADIVVSRSAMAFFKDILEKKFQDLLRICYNLVRRS
jgi:hypothetical protein